MLIKAAMAVSLCTLAGADNLLGNPGFDVVEATGMPRQWELFVMPMEGAVGRLDGQAASPPHAAMLHNPEHYDEEPANNWSQHIIANLAGQVLRVSGSIKTENATEAAIWLQCWSKAPLRVLDAITSSTDFPIYGTRDWSPVDMMMSVPAGTDFLLVRCVLKGRGTAWFDDLRMQIDGEEAETPDDDAIDVDGQARAPDLAAAEVRRANEAMESAIGALRQTNEALLAQVQILQNQLDALRARVERAKPKSAAGTVPKPAGDRRAIPKPRQSKMPGISPRATAAGPVRRAPKGPPLVPRRRAHEKTGQ